MKKLLLTLAVLSMTAVSTTVLAQDASDQLDVKAEIIVPLEIVCDVELDLGKFVAAYGVSSAESTVALERAGVAANAGSTGSCEITGQEGATFDLFVEDVAAGAAPDKATLAHGSESDTLIVNLVDAADDSLMDSTTRVMPVGGEMTLEIDGSIDALNSDGKAHGVYQGKALITVSY